MNAKNLIGGLLAGAALGVAVGLLLAPASGTKTQKRLAKGARKRADKLKGTAQYSVQSWKDEFNHGAGEVASKAADLI